MDLFEAMNAGPERELSAVAALAKLTGLDGKALAVLISARRGVGGVLSTPPAQLRAFGVAEEAAEMIASAVCLARQLAREEAIGSPVLSAWDKVLAYVRTELAHEGTERAFVLFLDRKNALISAETIGTGTVDHAPIYPREIVKKALLLDASSLILVHNHPSGDTTPSRADIDMTRDVAKACATVGIALHDHLIVGRSGHASLRALGLM